MYYNSQYQQCVHDVDVGDAMDALFPVVFRGCIVAMDVLSISNFDLTSEPSLLSTSPHYIVLGRSLDYYVSRTL